MRFCQIPPYRLVRLRRAPQCTGILLSLYLMCIGSLLVSNLYTNETPISRNLDKADTGSATLDSIVAGDCSILGERV